MSKPRSSTVAPTIRRPSGRGTRYTRSEATIRRQTGWSGFPRRVRIWPFTGRTGGRAKRRQPGRRSRPGAGGQDHVLGAMLAPVRGDHPGEAAVVDEGVRDLGLDEHLAPAMLHRGGQGGHQKAGVDGRLTRRMNTGGAGRREPRLEVPAGTRAQPLDPEVERLHQLEAAAQLLGLVAIEGDVERAAGLVADLQLAVGGELGREPGPGSGGGQRQAHQRLLAPARLADRGEHPRGHVGGSGARAGRARAPERAPPGAPPATRRPARSPHRRPPRRPGASGAPSAERDRFSGTTTSSRLRRWPLSVVGHGRLSSSRAGQFRATIPAPALPGSGSDGRRPDAALSAPARRGSRCASMVLPWLRDTAIDGHGPRSAAAHARGGAALLRLRGPPGGRRSRARCSTRRCGAARTSSSCARSPRAAPRS